LRNQGRPGFGKLYTASTEVPGSGKPDFPSPHPQGHVSHHNVLAEWSIDPKDSNRVDPGSRRELLRIAHPRHDHVMSQLGFAPHAKPGEPDYGMLYIGVGDGGDTSAQDGKVNPWRTAQNRLVPFGKILRINPLASGERRYSIPRRQSVRPRRFVPEGDLGAGITKPRSASAGIQAGDHRMLIADIGQAQIEEINIGQAGANYGWAEREGMFVVDPNDSYHPVAAACGRRTSQLHVPGGPVPPRLSGRRSPGALSTAGKPSRSCMANTFSATSRPGASSSSRRRRSCSGRPSPFGEIKLRYLGRERSLLEIVGGDPRADLRFGWTSTARSTSSPSATA
jgi:hypothetical protein